MELLDPKNDFVFKTLFAQAPALLEKLLARRFGPLNEGVLARLQSASAADLSVFADRILDASNLEGVFSVR